MPRRRFGADKHEPSLDRVRAVAERRDIATISGLADGLGMPGQKDRARTLAMDAGVYDDLIDDRPLDPGTGGGGA